MPAEEHPIHGRHRAVTTPTRWFRARLWLADALWLPVFIGNGLAMLLALVLPLVDEHLGRDRRLPLTLASVQSIFSAMAAGMITFTGIVFSAIFIAAQIQTSSYSPRLAARLRRDPVIVGALAMSTATATYALFALAAVGRSAFAGESGRAVPAVTVLFGLLIAVATLGQFSLLVQRAFDNIQIGGILRSLTRNAWRVIDDVHPHPAGAVATTEATPPSSEHPQIVLHEGKPGVIAAIDRRGLLRLAARTGGCVEVVPFVGEFISPGDEALRLHGAERPAPADSTKAVFVLARQRTIDQDPAFVIRMLVDIAIRALSPAVNDPTTAVQVIDRIETTLVELWRRHPGPTYVSDGAAHATAFVNAQTWSDYFELGASEIRRYGMASLQVNRRLRAMHEHLSRLVAGADLAHVRLELRLLDEAAQTTFPDPDEIAIARVPDRLGLGGV